MNPRPRGKYKKKQYNLILYLKITLIGYLAIFGVAYMSSNTSAYLSSQSVITEAISAGIWEVPVVLACEEEDLVETVPGEESEPNTENKANPSQEETANDAIASAENEMDCVTLDGAPGTIADAGNTADLECKKTEVPVSDEPVTEAAPVTNDKVESDCKKEDKDKDKDKEVDKDKDKAAEDVETPTSDKKDEKKDAEKDEKEAEKDKATEDVEAPANDKEKASEEVETPASDKEKVESPHQKELTPVEKDTEKDSGTKEGSGESKENEGQKSNDKSQT